MCVSPETNAQCLEKWSTLLKPKQEKILFYAKWKQNIGDTINCFRVIGNKFREKIKNISVSNFIFAERNFRQSYVNIS